VSLNPSRSRSSHGRSAEKLNDGNHKRRRPAFGMLAAVLQITAVTLPLFGRPVIFPLMAPLGLAGLALAAWLLTKGFTEREFVGVKERT
jgi:hypothetical protein